MVENGRSRGPWLVDGAQHARAWEERGCTRRFSRACEVALQDSRGDEVRCRLVATQLANDEREEVSQSSPPLMVADAD